jgi:L-threonylcarbamoyladenylate synthase
MTVMVKVATSGPDPGVMDTAAVALRRGGIVALPTDTVYGLAVDPRLHGAVERLFSLKGRPADVPLPIMVGTRAQVRSVVGRLDGAAADLARRFWPGPLTLVVPRVDGFCVDLGGPRSARHTVGIRWPDHRLMVAMCARLGPLAVTSANRHGSPPATTADQVAEALAGADQLTVIVDGGPCRGDPSTVVECLGPQIRCLREGAIACSEISGPNGPDS